MWAALYTRKLAVVLYEQVLTFGGTHSPLTTASPSSYYWGINQSILYGSSTILSTTAGIHDTGTSLILIATDAYKKYISATGATYDSITGLLKITVAQYTALQTLYFTIGGVSTLSLFIDLAY